LIQRSNFLLTDLNVHRVVITSVLLAAKFFDDAYYNNAYYAKVGGVMVSEMNGLEVDFLFRINFSLHVTPEVFGKYRAELVVHSGSAAVPPPLSPVMEAAHSSPPPGSVSPCCVTAASASSPAAARVSPYHFDAAAALHAAAAAEALLNANQVAVHQAPATLSHGIIVTDAEDYAADQNDRPVYFPPMQRANSMPGVLKPSLVAAAAAAAAAAPLFTSMPARIGGVPVGLGHHPAGASSSSSSRLPSYEDPLLGLVERACIYPIQNSMAHHHHPVHPHPANQYPVYYPHPHHHYSSSDSAAYNAQQLVGRMLASTMTGI
jgi:hypothetical protein